MAETTKGYDGALETTDNSDERGATPIRLNFSDGLREILAGTRDFSTSALNKRSRRAEEETYCWFELGEVVSCVLNHAHCDDRACEDCNLLEAIPVRVEFDWFFATGHAFIFEASSGIDFSVVLPKDQALDCEIEQKSLPEPIAEQLQALSAHKPLSFLVQTWSEERTRRHPEGQRFVEFMTPGVSNALIVFTIWEGLPFEQQMSTPDKRFRDQIGALDYGFLNVTPELDGDDFGYEYWIFQYDNTSNHPPIPSDSTKDEIDTSLRRQVASSKAQENACRVALLINQLQRVTTELINIEDEVEAYYRQRLLEGEALITEGEFTDWDQSRLRAEARRLKSEIELLTTKAREYLQELGVDTSELESEF